LRARVLGGGSRGEGEAEIDPPQAGRWSEGREYWRELSSDIAHAGNLARLRELDDDDDLSIADYPNVAAWRK